MEARGTRNQGGSPFLRPAFTLYLSGVDGRSTRAQATVEALCRDLFGSNYDLRVVDVRADPAAAEEARIIATPTIVRRIPPPERRVVGDMSDGGRLGDALELVAPVDGAQA